MIPRKVMKVSRGDRGARFLGTGAGVSGKGVEWRALPASPSGVFSAPSYLIHDAEIWVYGARASNTSVFRAYVYRANDWVLSLEWASGGTGSPQMASNGAALVATEGTVAQHGQNYVRVTSDGGENWTRVALPYISNFTGSPRTFREYTNWLYLYGGPDGFLFTGEWGDIQSQPLMVAPATSSDGLSWSQGASIQSDSATSQVSAGSLGVYGLGGWRLVGQRVASGIQYAALFNPAGWASLDFPSTSSGVVSLAATDRHILAVQNVTGTRRLYAYDGSSWAEITVTGGLGTGGAMAASGGIAVITPRLRYLDGDLTLTPYTSPKGVAPGASGLYGAVII